MDTEIIQKAIKRARLWMYINYVFEMNEKLQFKYILLLFAMEFLLISQYVTPCVLQCDSKQYVDLLCCARSTGVFASVY